MDGAWTLPRVQRPREAGRDKDRALLLALLERLLRDTEASRVTLRHGDGFPVTHETLAPGVGSIRDERSVDLRSQPVALEVGKGCQVVQNDSRTAYDDPAFLDMLAAYGGIGAQVVTPVMRDGDVIAILSVHQLGKARQWSDDEVARCRRTAEEIAELL